MNFEPSFNGSKNLKNRWINENHEKLLPLRKKLLKIGGKEVVPMREIHLKMLLNKGKIIDFSKITKIEGGQTSKCHQNSVLLYQQNDEITHIGTGWCLSEDGLWRQHSWCMINNEIIETTIERNIYFGLLFHGEKADEFIKSIKMY